MEQGNSFSLVLPGISFSLRRLCCVVVDDLVRKKENSFVISPSNEALLLFHSIFFFPLISSFPAYRFDSKRSQSCHFLKSPRPTDKVNLICLFSSISLRLTQLSSQLNPAQMQALGFFLPAIVTCDNFSSLAEDFAYFSDEICFRPAFNLSCQTFASNSQPRKASKMSA